MENLAIIENAIQRFYTSGENEDHQWLLHFQNSNEAWQYSWQLLNPNKPLEVQFFAANTLYAKISKQWFQLPESEQEFIRNQLICTIKQNLHKSISKSLCQSVAALLAHLNSVDKPNSDECLIDDLVQFFSYNDPVSLQFLLETLILIPAQFERKTGPEKIELRKSLLNSWPKIVWLIIQVLSTCNGPVKEENSNCLYLLALECLTLWLNISQFSLEVFEQLFPYMLLSCQRYLLSKQEDDEDSKGFDLTQDCLSIILTHYELSKHRVTFWKWMKALMSIINEQNVKYFYELLISIGSEKSRIFVLTLVDETKTEEKLLTENLIEYILRCFSEKGRLNYSHSAISFGFWYNLQDDIHTIDKPLDAKVVQALKPIYARLSMIMLKNSELPRTPEEAGNADEREMFRCYRQDIADTYVYCYRILRSEFLLLIGQRLSSPPEGENQWVHIESSIFAFTSISESEISPIETMYFKAIVDVILTKIRYENYPDQVLSSACVAIGTLSEWLIVNNDTWIEKCLQLLKIGLTKSTITSSSASAALLDIVRECGSDMMSLAPSILETVERRIRMINPDKGEGYRLMYIAGSLIGRIDNHEMQLHYLERILGFCIFTIKQTIEESPRSELSLKNQFKMISTFIPHLTKPIVKTVYDAVILVLQQSICNPILMENSTIVEAMLDTMNNLAISIVTYEQEAEVTSKLLKETYQKRPHPKAFPVLFILMNTHSKTGNETILQIFLEICDLTLAGANACVTSGGNLSELCDILKAFFSMLAQCIKKKSITQSKMSNRIPQLFQLGMMCLTLPEISTVQAASSFFVASLSWECGLPETMCQQLVCIILDCTVESKFILSNLQPHAEILYALRKLNLTLTRQLLKNALSSPNIPLIPDSDKEALLRSLLRYCTKSKLFEAMKDFGISCRQTKNGLVHH